MKTSELYFEPIAIGALVMAILLLPGLPKLLYLDILDIKEISTVAGIAGGSIALGIAFWLGIPFDRFADTLTDRLNRANRLRFALRLAVGKQLPASHEPDIFPEQQLLVDCMRDPAPILAWVDYHRSRIRLTRALAVYGPALTLMLTIALIGYESGIVPGPGGLEFILVGVAYTVWALIVTFSKPLPRTDDKALGSYADELHLRKNGLVQKTKFHDTIVWLREWRTLIPPMSLLIAAIIFAAFSSTTNDKWRIWLAAFGGIAMTVISAWSWWQISLVYRGYLHRLDQARPKLTPPRPSFPP